MSRLLDSESAFISSPLPSRGMLAMTDKFELKVYAKDDLDAFISKRSGETKAGESLSSLPLAGSLKERLKSLSDKRAHYAIVLIPEDIGPRGNHGRAGAAEAPNAFLKYFLNLQANKFIDFSRVSIIGEIVVDDLMTRSDGASTEELRNLCEVLDKRVEPVLAEIFRAGLEPIVIGGGNNNSLPILRALKSCIATTSGIACVNCDPHADFRPLEGRHSGNPFSYAHEEGMLKAYCVLGLHESYNSESMVTTLDRLKFPYHTYDEFAIRRSTTFTSQVEQCIEYLRGSQCPVGLELDLDSIIGMPVSAKTPLGITVEQALSYIHATASRLVTRYLHLSEGAPRWSGDDGEREVGKVTALAATTYIKARETARRSNKGTREIMKTRIGI